ncbi:hypothetical protein [Salsuginibacillus kocurii]|uniref:hypothetical protein n=1 Tax=Salsuginibacillus kocurii TaxID=427078 RepID=UPI0003788B5A|nr:hypothetical protein [Salsuginibacillus kocurii]
MYKKIIGLSFMAATFMGMIGCSSEETTSDPETFYEENNDLEILVPTSSGGGSDIMARFMAPFLNKHISGEPATQVENVEGGGTITGANEFALGREADGETTFWTSISTTTAYLLDNPAIEFDYDDMTPILGYPDGGVVYVSPDTGVTGPDDLMETEEPLTYGGTSATGLPLTTILSFEVLGLDVDSVFGYESSGPARVAFEQGETNIDFQTTSSYFSNVEPLVEDGSAVPLYSIGVIEDGELVRDPQFPELPTVKEIYEEEHGEEPSGPEWDAFKSFVGAVYTIQKVLYVHDDIPDAALTALQEGVEGMVNDPEYKEEGEEVFGYDPVYGEELEDELEELLDLDDEVQEWTLNYLEQEHDETLE